MPESMHQMPLDPGSGAGPRGPPRANGVEPLGRQQRSLPSDTFPHEMGAAAASKAAPLRALRAAPHRSPAEGDVDCNGSPITGSPPESTPGRYVA
jgi:hypothetical protein